MKKPYISGDWKLLFKPEKNGNYINDHTIVIGSDGKWHLYGITSFESSPSFERYFVHGVGENLHTQFTEDGRSIDKGTLAWAPCVIRKDDNYCNTMVFCSEDPQNFGVYNGKKTGTKPITILNAHAPEILQENGKYYITTCGWRGKPLPHEGAVSIATLEWK